MQKRKAENKFIPVLLIERNLLAAQHVLQVLTDNASVRHCQDLDQAATHIEKCVVVLDSITCSIPPAICIHRLKIIFPDALILLLVDSLKNEEICNLLWLGISGVLRYSEVKRSLHVAIQHIWEGHLWVDMAILELFVRKNLGASRKRGSSLFTAMEQRILELLGQRLSNKEIGASLDITPRTVKFHLANIFTKIGVHDRLSAFEHAKNRLAGL